MLFNESAVRANAFFSPCNTGFLAGFPHMHAPDVFSHIVVRHNTVMF